MGKLLIISGGSKGLGKSLVEIYSSRGWDIIELSRSGNSKFNFRVDFNKPDEIDNWLSKILINIDKDNITELHIINNAATLTPIDKNYRIDTSLTIQNMNINVVSSIIFLNYLTKDFRKLDTPKTIVNISSGAALKGYSGWSLYCASKAAMENYMNSIMIQEEDEKFPFSAINFDPGVMDTQMQEEIRSSKTSQFPTLERFIDLKKNNELRSPESVAELLSELLKTKPYSGRYSVKDLDLQ